LRKYENRRKFSSETLKRRYNLDDVHLGGRVISKWVAVTRSRT